MHEQVSFWARRGRRLIAVIGVVLAFALVAGACGDDGDDSTSDPGTSAPGSEESGEPKAGGTLKMGVWAFPSGLDPITYFGSGNTGGTELGAIYDRLVEWDPEAKEYRPKTAESVTPNEDFTKWRITVRPGITFGDGTAYDAGALKFNFERQKKDNTTLRGALSSITDITVVDPRTVEVTLAEPWAGFEYLLSMSFGMIASPTAITKLGPDFATRPEGAGAGPFEYVAYRANEIVQLKRNENYWGGDVPLDGLEFVYFGGGDATYEALLSGGVDVALLREPEPVAKSKNDGYGGADLVFSAGEILLVNNGVEVTCTGGAPDPICTGKADGTKVATKSPGTNEKIRRAIALAVDTKVIDERAYGGEGVPARSIFDESFPWDPGVEFDKANIQEARSLVEQAKAEGWDGKIRLLCTNSPARVATGLAVATSLESAGMSVDTSKTNVDTAAQLAEVITKKDYDLSCWGLQLSPDDGAQLQLESFLRSTSLSNRTGYKSTAMDAAISEMKRAADDGAKTAAYKRIAELFQDAAISVPIAHVGERIVWSDDVHGVRTTAQSAVLFDKAWRD